MLTCPTCAEENPERAKFCLSCGTPLAAEPTPGRMERKFATALFADLVGSTTLAEQEDPEVVQSVVGRTFDRLSAEITRYGGHLEKFMGDAVLAVFGIPRAHEDDPERAVRAAMEMQAVLSELNRTFAAEGKPQLAMRVGLEAGEVLVDLQRATGPHDRMLTGDAVNTAARLQTAADPGNVVVGPGVYASVKDVIELFELPPLTLKGKAEPVPAWKVGAVIAKRRGERPALGMEAPLIGRDEELTVLKQTLQRVESEGRPALVTIIGPAGVGKSRLVSELATYTEGLPAFYYWRTGRCLAYGNTSYSAFADAIKAQCEVLEDDPIDVVHAKTDTVVEELFGDLELAPAIRALVTSGDRAFSREELFEAWRRFLERMAARYPLVLVLEDIHWADEGLLDLIEHVADWAQGPVMVVALARAELFERRPTWGGGKRNAVSIYLDPLTPEEDAMMVDALLPGDVPEALRAMIVERAEGNPLFTEEIVRMLIDRGVLRATEASRWEAAATVEDVDVPRSIQGLIAARLDGLPDDEKLMLQDAAVVGREFWLGSVAELSGLDPGAAREVLGRLRVKELIVPHETSGFGGESEFSFRHLLLRDGAYDSLPKQLRAEKHAAVARWAAARAGERADEMAQLIATHTLEALRYREELGDAGPAHDETVRAAYRWSRAAGDRTVALWLLQDAIDWYEAAARLGERAGVPLEERLSLARVHADTAFGTALLEENLRIDRHFLALAEEAGDEHAAGYALARLSHPVFTSGDDAEGTALARAAIERLEPLGDSLELAFALRTLGWFGWRRGQIEEAEPALRRAIEIADRVDAPVIRADATQDLGVTLSMLGRKDECLRVIEEAYVLAKATGDFTVMSRAYVNYPSTMLNWTSDFGLARAITAEGVEFARKAGAHERLAWLQGNLSDLICLERGPLDDAKTMAIECVELADAVSARPLLAMRLGGLGCILVERGEIDEARAVLDRANEIDAVEPEPQAELLLRYARGLLASQLGDHDEAVAQLVPAIEIARRFHADSEAQLYPPLLRSLLATGGRGTGETYRDLTKSGSPFGVALGRVVGGLLATDPAEAVATLTDAVAGLEAIPALPELGRALIDLAAAQARSGIDPAPTFARAREVFTGSQAVGWLPDVDAAEAALARPPEVGPGA